MVVLLALEERVSAKGDRGRLMECEELLTGFLSEYSEYNDCIEYQDGVPLIDWSGLGAFLTWLRHNNHISDAVFDRADELFEQVETR